MAINTAEDKLFKTPNTALAAYLFSEGYTLVEVDCSQEPFLFVFQSDNHLKDAVRDFEIGRAEGNILMFFRAYKKMIHKVKVGKLPS